MLRKPSKSFTARTRKNLDKGQNLANGVMRRLGHLLISFVFIVYAGIVSGINGGGIGFPSVFPKRFSERVFPIQMMTMHKSESSFQS